MHLTNNTERKKKRRRRSSKHTEYRSLTDSPVKNSMKAINMFLDIERDTVTCVAAPRFLKAGWHAQKCIFNISYCFQKSEVSQASQNSLCRTYHENTKLITCLGKKMTNCCSLIHDYIWSSNYHPPIQVQGSSEAGVNVHRLTTLLLQVSVSH